MSELAQEMEYEIPGGSLYYMTETDGDKNDEYVIITRMQGTAGEIRIPESIRGIPVRVIGRKAFLSKKNLRKVEAPESVTVVGDWAFAYCDSLHTVRFDPPQGSGSGTTVTESLNFGRSVFMECSSLRYLYLGDQKESTAALLAAAVTAAEAPYLLDAAEAGNREWLEKWDARMLAILDSADNEGYSRQVLCGEEDYGSTDLSAYESARRKAKVRLILLRLLYPDGLREEHRCRMETYLREHTAGCGQEETWQVILREHGEERDYYRLFARLGCINSENFDRLLSDAGEDYPELKAYFLRYREEAMEPDDFFAGLEL